MRLFPSRLLPGVVSILMMIGGAVAAAAPPATASTASPALAAIAERYFQDFVTLNPLAGSATLGEARFEDKLEITIAPAHKARSKALYQRVQRELARLDKTKLSAADALTVTLLTEETSKRLESFTYPGELMPIDQYGGLQVEIAQFGNGQGIQPLKTVKNVENYLKRLNRLPTFVDQAITNMREGMLPLSVLEAQVDRWIALQLAEKKSTS